MLLLQEGHVEEAIAMCHARLAANGIDAESHLVLALAYGLQGRLDDAKLFGDIIIKTSQGTQDQGRTSSQVS